MDFGFLLVHRKYTAERIARAYQVIDIVLGHQSKNSLVIKVRALSSVMGQIIYMQSVFGKLVCLKTRALHEYIISKANWKTPVLVTEDAVYDLKVLKR